MRFVLALCFLLPVAAPAKDRECSKKCDELLKTMAADCRKGEGGKHKGEESHNDAEACQAALKKIRAGCVKDCQQVPKRAR
ncbi:MAG: hypothetical protein JNJ54_36310 [Myxococcaceae bacterium]|nr:hypothetical protein [Myxococcaceae bacterium]